MKPNISTLSFFLLVLVAAAIATTPSAAAAPVQFKVLHSFSGADGSAPNSLIQAADGFFYGSAANGGDVTSCPSDGCGLLFKSDTAGNITVLHVFHATDGYFPTGLVKGSDGNVYGTNEGAGGSVFRVDANGIFSFVNKFDGADGWNPQFRLLQAADGFFYGTAPQGGLLDFQGGDTFRISTRGALRVMHSFVLTGTEGFSPSSTLIQGIDGALYGVNGGGGVNKHGTLFRIDQRIQGPVASVTVNPTIMHSGQTSIGTVTLSSLAPAGGKVVSLGAANSFQMTIPASVKVPAGAKTAAFMIKALQVGEAQTVRIYASFAGQGVRTTLRLQP
jgi:uncharacterized repeat protein (TIGR03803 family)